MLDWQIWWGNEPLHLPGAGIHCVSGICDLEAGAIGSLTCVLPPTHKLANADFLVGSTAREVILRDGNTELFRGRVISCGKNMDAETEIQCEGMLAYLKDSVVRPYASRYTTDLPTGTVILDEDPFLWMIKQHNLHVGPNKSFEIGVNPHRKEIRASTDYKSTWDEMNDAYCTGFDRYLYAHTGARGQRILSLLDGGRGESGQAIVLGENIIDINMARDSGDIVTVIIARGTRDDIKQMQAGDRPEHNDFGLEDISDGPIQTSWGTVIVAGDRIYNQTLVNRFGWREEMRHYEAKTPSELVKLAAEDLNPSEANNREVNSIEVSAVDLSTLNPNVAPLRLLEWAIVYCPPHGINQWLPCSKIHIDVGDPGATTYLFGDLPQTLTRQSALRMGMLTRRTGELIRRSDGTTVDNDRSWGAIENDREDIDGIVDKIREDEEDEGRYREETKGQIDGLIDGLGEIGDGIVDLNKNFNTEIDGLRTLVEANEKEAAENLDNLEESLGGQIGRLDDAVGDLDKKIDGVSKLGEATQEKAQQAADEAAKALLGSIYYGTCSTDGGTQIKVVSDATSSNGKAFELTSGTMAIITFEHANTNSEPAININNTGSHYIRTNGVRQAYWQDGQSVGIIYDGNTWTTPSSPVWATEVMAGNPAGFNFYTNGSKIALRYGDQQYVSADGTGIQVGFTAIRGQTTAVGTRNIYIGSNRLALRQGQTEYMSFDDDGIQVGMDRWPNIHIGSSTFEIRRPEADQSLAITYDNNGGGGTTYSYRIWSKGGVGIQNGPGVSSRVLVEPDNNIRVISDADLFLWGSTVVLGDTTNTNNIRIHGFDYQLNGRACDLPMLVDTVRRSIVMDPGHSTNVIHITASSLGLSSLSHYAWIVTNGDWVANNFIVTGTSAAGNTLYVHLDREIGAGSLRLNLVGLQTKEWNPYTGYN